jgi:formylglycine-generating enzyme required for sulfatase activity
MSAAVENYRGEMSVSYAVDFDRDREPTQKRSRFPDYRRKGSAPARVSGMHCRRNKRWTWGSGRGARTLNARAFASSMAFAIVSLAATAFGVTIDYTTVGNPGNSANTNGWGAVSNVFDIAKTETSNSQYAEFLNAVDATGSNPNGVYNASMGSDALGGISFNSGAPNGSKYSAKAGAPAGAPVGTNYAQMPVVFTTWFSAARFANWLENGQQTNSSSMETGAYTLNNQTSGAIVARNPGAVNVLPSRDEWYKAGFYNGSSYTAYPTNSNTAPTNTVTNVTLANVANYGAGSTPTVSPINVGSYVNTTSAYGAFDMLGNATEYTDTAGTGADAGRPQLFSGSWATPLASVGSWNSTAAGIFRNSTTTTGQVGFRVAAVPEPATIALASVGIASLAGLEWMKRRKKKATAARPLA